MHSLAIISDNIVEALLWRVSLSLFSRCRFLRARERNYEEARAHEGRKGKKGVLPRALLKKKKKKLAKNTDKRPPPP